MTITGTAKESTVVEAQASSTRTADKDPNYEPTINPNDAQTERTTAESNIKALDQIFGHLRAKDDTARFVGLSLLRSVLDVNESLRTDKEIIKKCWMAVPNKFLVRLLRPGTTDDSRHMNDLAVAVIHTFVNLLPEEATADKKVFELVEPMGNIVTRLDGPTLMLALQSMQCIVSTPAGAHVFARATFHESLKAIVSKLDGQFWTEIVKLYDVAFSMTHDAQLKEFLASQVIYTLHDGHRHLQYWVLAYPVLNIMNDPRSHEEVLNAIWLAYDPQSSRSVSQSLNTESRIAAVKLASQYLESASDIHRPGEAGYRLFKGPASGLTNKSPFVYIFAQFVLIEIRSTIPSLMHTLASEHYKNDALRLAACYDVISALIAYLSSMIKDEDEDVDGGGDDVLIPEPIDPDLLLKLSRDLAETFSLTLEFFRDRWEATNTGATGLDPSARRDPKAPPMLTWDNPTVPPEEDPIILSGVRCLALWLRDDENPDLNAQALGILDVLIALYELSMNSEAKVDFRSPVSILLIALMRNTEEAAQVLFSNNAWDIFTADLRQSLTKLTETKAGYSHTIEDLANIMITMVNSEAVPGTRRAWLDVIKMAASIDPAAALNHNSAHTMRSISAVYDLALAIAEPAPRNLQKLASVNSATIAANARVLAGYWSKAPEMMISRSQKGYIQALVRVADEFEQIAALE